MKEIESILQTSMYTLLFGGGGILTIVVSVVSVMASIKKKNPSEGNIIVEGSKKTEIRNNKAEGKTIQVERSEDTVINDNK